LNFAFELGDGLGLVVSGTKKHRQHAKTNLTTETTPAEPNTAGKPQTEPTQQSHKPRDTKDTYHPEQQLTAEPEKAPEPQHRNRTTFYHHHLFDLHSRPPRVKLERPTGRTSFTRGVYLEYLVVVVIAERKISVFFFVVFLDLSGECPKARGHSPPALSLFFIFSFLVSGCFFFGLLCPSKDFFCLLGLCNKFFPPPSRSGRKPAEALISDEVSARSPTPERA